MLFSSITFIFLFLPVVLFFYYIAFRKSRLLQNVFDQVNDKVNSIIELKKYAEEQGAGFLCVAIPKKAQYDSFPQNVSDNSEENYQNYLATLYENDVPTLDCKEALRQEWGLSTR